MRWLGSSLVHDIYLVIIDVKRLHLRRLLHDIRAWLIITKVNEVATVLLVDIVVQYAIIQSVVEVLLDQGAACVADRALQTNSEALLRHLIADEAAALAGRDDRPHSG